MPRGKHARPLYDELRFVEDRQSWLGIDGEPVEVIRRACAGAEPPIDWLDSGVYDLRYQWAHFLTSFDGRFGSLAVEGLFGLANKVLCPNADRDAFARALRVGEIMDRIIRAGSKARTAEAGADNTDRAAKLRAHIQRLAAIL